MPESSLLKNIIERLQFELTYHDIAVEYVNHYGTQIPPWIYIYIYIMNISTKRFIFLKTYLFRSYICVCFRLVAFAREHIWVKALWMGNSLRLELIRAWRVVSWLCVYIEGVYLSLFTPNWSLVFDVFVCLLEWFRISLTVISFSPCVCILSFLW